MTIKKTYEEINKKIENGKAVVVTAEEVIGLVKEKGVKKTAADVDVVTTATFGPMCSSGAFFNFSHPKPRIRMSSVSLNGVPAYAGIAAVDAYLGATELPRSDPANSNFPGEFNYGGGHVIEDLLAGKEVLLEAASYGTDCYPRRKLETVVTLQDFPYALLFNPRNCYQNYNIAVNLSDRTLYTYMGILKPNLGNANFSTSGQLSPLFNDPLYRTIGLGTRIFLGGGEGYVAWHGTQHHPDVNRGNNQVPKSPGGTLALMGDLKHMSPRWVRGVSFLGYGVTLMVGVGIPIPILDEEMLAFTGVTDEDIYAPIVDYSEDYPQKTGKTLGEVSYAQLKKGHFIFEEQEVPTAPLSSIPGARQIARLLKEWIEQGNFMLTEPVVTVPLK